MITLHREDQTMDYESFKIEYTRIFLRLLDYMPDQGGSEIFAQELADLADNYPEFDARLEAEK